MKSDLKHSTSLSSATVDATDGMRLRTTTILPLGFDHTTGKAVSFAFDQTAEWTEKGNDWWWVVQRVGRKTASVYIKRPPGWKPADGFTPREIKAANIYSGQLHQDLS